MRQSDFSWREYRPHTTMFNKIPHFADTQTTKTPSYRHHVSMYGISQEEASIQQRLGNTKNRRVQHFSSELIIDTDSYESAVIVWDTLYKYDYHFELWQLNNFKFFLLRNEEDKPSDIMCYQDKEFVKSLFLTETCNDKIDTSIYCSPFHIIRAKNSIHEGTGARSVLLDTHIGQTLVQTNSIALPPPKIVEFDPNQSDWEMFQQAVSFAKGKGGCKHVCIWQIAKDICKFFTYDTGLEIIKIYARGLDYAEEKATRAFKQAYEAVVC